MTIHQNETNKRGVSDPETMSERGRKGAEALNSKPEDERSQIAERAAQTRGSESLSEAGKKGAEARNEKSEEELSQISEKAAQTRKENNPDAFKEMGQKGGHARHAA